ncbi:MAG: putative ABC transporter permease [Candidatus Saccharibacteria bacterium]|nr:putative ABC transporter permease [Candidatus Saccharibacteria bacterium]
MKKKTKRKPLLPYQKLGIIFLIVVISGFFGWVYEVIFYFFNNGMDGFYMQGGNFLPWINIYAIGALAVLFLTYKLREKPWLIFFLSMLITGTIELVGGWLVYVIGNGTRYWDYNVEILNFGNIGGFTCLRSVLFFGISCMFLMYVVLPFCVKLSRKLSKPAFLILSISLFSIVMLDEVGNLVAKNSGLPTAMDFYRSQGIKYND